MGVVRMYRWGYGCCCKEVYRYPHELLLFPTPLVLALFLAAASLTLLLCSFFNVFSFFKINDKLSINWDSQSNMDSVKEKVASLLKGCGYKTGYQIYQCEKGFWVRMQLYKLYKNKNIYKSIEKP